MNNKMIYVSLGDYSIIDNLKELDKRATYYKVAVEDDSFVLTHSDMDGKVSKKASSFKSKFDDFFYPMCCSEKVAFHELEKCLPLASMRKRKRGKFGFYLIFSSNSIEKIDKLLMKNIVAFDL